MEKFKITIEKVTEYDEYNTAYRDPANPEKIYSSKYDAPESIREDLVSHQRATGKKLNNLTQVFEQTVDTLDMEKVIKAVNNIA